MKSPFPGMDPFIEDRGLWPDFHTKVIGEIERALAAVLPERYFIQTGERAYVVLAGTDEKETKPIYPDVGIEKSAPVGRASASGGALAVAEPVLDTGGVTMRAFIDEHFRENFIEIYEAEPGPRLVTCIEVLSPSNKRSGKKGWKLYLRKRNALLLGKANLVEIDLVRGGRRMPMVEPWPKSPYYLLVGRESHVPYCRVWPSYFNQPLPEVPVPLASPDSDLPLALQPMIEAVYERSRYARRLDYSKPLTPPLGPEETAWLAGRLRGEEAQTKPPTPPKRRGRRR
ncbi:MAG: DUF4058 family protein [Planctomycetes bacterium]|nr:DUF4058 family protein [Planctomycetota bacterium]